MAITTITNSMVSVNAIQGTLIADNAITAVHIASNAVASIQIAENNVTAREIASNSITVAQLADDSVESDKIADGVITTNHLNKAMISSQTEVAVATGDFVLLGDTSDSNNLKKAPISSILAGTLTAAAQTNITSVGTLTGLTTSGNVGIGGAAADPQGFGRSLHVEGATNAAIYLRDTGNSNYGYIGFVGGSTNKMALNSYQGYLSFTTGAGVEMVRIAADGVISLVGSIYDTGPSTVRIGSVADASANGTGSLQFVNSNGHLSWQISAGGTPAGALAFTQSSANGGSTFNNEAMRIGSGGEVGIGETSPTANLHIKGSGGGDGVNMILHNTGNAPAGVRLLSGHGNWEMVNSKTVADMLEFIDDSAGVTRMCINTSGKVGIGTTSPTHTLHAVSGDAKGFFLDRTSGSNAANLNEYSTHYSLSIKSRASGSYLNFGGSGDYSSMQATDGAGSAAAKILSLNPHGGQVLIGMTTAHATDFKLALLADASTAGIGTQNTSTGSTNYAALFRSNGASTIGSINVTNTATQFNTSSDYRLKENVRPIENGLERLNSLNPVKFDWKDDGTSSEGFIAHEAHEVFPDAVTGEKDAAMMQGMDYGRITPLLVKAIQELKAELDAAKARIETLEG